MRFNPPPNWPPSPPGWVPDSNWVPDPAWPPPPPGWQLWVDDSAPQYPPQLATGYPPQFPPQYPSQWQPPLPPGPTSRKGLWIALVAITAVVLVAAAAIFAFGAGGGPTSAGGGKASGKSDITQLTEDLLVGRSAFPEIDGGEFDSGKIDLTKETSGRPDFSVSPQECGQFLIENPKSATQIEAAAVGASDSSGFRTMRVQLAITTDRQDLKDFVSKCRSFTVSFEISGSRVDFKTTLEPLEVSGVPPWAVATVASQSDSPGGGITSSTLSAEILGYYRGVLVSANYSAVGPGSKGVSIDSQTKADLVKLFNAQVEKLEAAP